LLGETVNYAGTHHLNLAPCRGGNVRNHFFVSASARFSKSSFGSTGTRSPFRNFVPGLAQSIGLALSHRIRLLMAGSSA
jgi:hypothetical protein